MSRLLVILAALAWSLPVHAQTIAITGGTVHTLGPAGTLDGATVLIADGRISAVGVNVRVPDAATVIDATGKVVTPGIFDAMSRVAIAEVSLVSSTRDDTAGEAPFASAFDVTWGVNPNATNVAVTRIEGVTRAALFPGARKSLFAGRGALIHLGTGYDMVFAPSAFAYLELGETGADLAGGGRGAAWVTLLEALDEGAALTTSPRGQDHDKLLNQADAQVARAIVRGDLPVVIHVERASDILNVLALKPRYERLRIAAIVGAAEGWMVADRIAAAGVPVMTDVTQNLPYAFEALGSTLENAARLRAAGVTVAVVSGGDTHNSRLVLQLAGNAVANGLPWEDGLKAVTLNPARIYGVDDRLGSLEAGKIADVVVWDGDPLELMSAPDAVIVNGQLAPLVSRQTRLRDRYRDLDDPTPFAYRR